MPELPEVETIARQLRGFVVGRTVAGFRSEWHRLTEPEPAELFGVCSPLPPMQAGHA